jgi:hypothetical protein
MEVALSLLPTLIFLIKATLSQSLMDFSLLQILIFPILVTPSLSLMVNFKVMTLIVVKVILILMTLYSIINLALHVMA